MKQNVLILFISIVAIVTSAMAAPTTQIRGRIIDARNGEALVGASIYVEQVKRGVVTDRKGDFHIDGLASGAYTVQFSYIGYEQHTENVVLAAGESKRLEIALHEESQTLEQVMIVAKSEARKIREQAMPISVISMKQLQGQVSDMEGILSKTVGIAIRQSGGVGSATRARRKTYRLFHRWYFVERPERLLNSQRHPCRHDRPH